MYEQFKFDLARNSLRYLISSCSIKEIYIPYYLCDVIRHSVVAENCNPIFYHINDEFYPLQKFPENSYILYPNYFGICDENVNRLEQIYPGLIVDNAHAFYLPPQGFACFNSERKFLPVKSGSLLYIKKEGKSDIINQICPNTRIENFKNMHKIFEKGNQLNIKADSVKSPFCYPYLAKTEEEADKLADNLTIKGLTIYRYWNNLPKTYNEYKFYRRLVPIPIS